MKAPAKERPILFSAPMVRALLAGTKTQTRRTVHERLHLIVEGDEDTGRVVEQSDPEFGRLATKYAACPYGTPGERLWVRETWRTMEDPDTCVDGVRFCADGAFVPIENSQDAADLWIEAHDNGKHGAKWRPSIFMKHWASRITLEVTSMRVERLCGITRADAIAEGVTAGERASETDAFHNLWDSINGKRAAWASNPWVWVVSFKRVQP